MILTFIIQKSNRREMISQQKQCTIKLFKHLRRYWNSGSLVVKSDSKNGVLDVGSCVKSKTRNTKQDDPENVWLENLNLENLKLYRKTSFGSYRKINLQNFFEKLKVILTDEFKIKEALDKSKKSVKDESVQVEKKENVFPSPYMSESIMQNMVTFPLLKSQCEDSLRGIVKDQEELEIMKYPSVTRILQETLPPERKQVLDRWQFLMIQKMGPTKFEEYRQDTFNQGAKFHGALKKYLESGEEKLVSIDQSIEGCWNSISQVLEDINDVVFVEESVSHPILSYKGYVDCVASYKGVPHVIEWKKSGKKVKSISKLYDAPVQACAYLGALSWRKDLALAVPKKCLLVSAYTNGDPADVFSLDLDQCQVYWSDFLHRLQGFWARRLPDLKPDESQM